MSAYYDFRKCTVCRSNYLRNIYCGNFGVTMLLNTMYLAVMQQLERIDGSGLKSKEIAEKLKEYGCSIQYCTDERPAKDHEEVCRSLRNGLAHFNIFISPDPYDNIDSVVIYGMKEEAKEELRKEQDDKKRRLKAKENYLYMFEFPIKSLERFTDYIIDRILMDSEVCKNCPSKDILRSKGFPKDFLRENVGGIPLEG